MSQEEAAVITRPEDTIASCPRCGQARSAPPTGHFFNCTECGFRLYFNVATGTCVLLRDSAGKMLFIRRGKDPGRGMLGMPGGFADPNESAEEGARREVLEEVGLVVDSLEYLCSHPNPYLYRGITYPVLDLFFIGTLAADSDITAITTQAGEVTGYEWHDPSMVDPAELSFPSMRFALRQYLLRSTPV